MTALRRPARTLAPWCTALLLASCATPRPPGHPVLFPSPYLEALVTPPADYDSARVYPLLVALHGFGDTAAEFARAFASPEWRGCIVAVPEAENAAGNGGFSWYPATRDRSLWPALDGHLVGAVVALIEALRARYHVGPVYVLGFSQGATLAFQAGLLHPALVTGVLAVAGARPDVDTLGAIVHTANLERARTVRLFVARGREDAGMSRRAFVAQADFFATRGFAVTRYEFDGGHDLPPEVMARAARWLREAPPR